MNMMDSKRTKQFFNIKLSWRENKQYINNTETVSRDKKFNITKHKEQYK